MKAVKLFILLTMLLIFLFISGCCCLSSTTTSSSFGENNYVSPSPYSSSIATSTAYPYATSTSTPAVTVKPSIAPTATPLPSPTKPPVSLPTGSYIKRIAISGEGELEISNGLDLDAVIIIASTFNPSSAFISVYVRAHDEFTVSGIPDGYYYIYYMTGSDWNSTTGKFTKVGVYKKFEDKFDYVTTESEYTSWEIGLKPVVGGNADTDYVSPENFPS